MAPIVLTDCVIWVDGFAATLYSNKVSLKMDIDDQETTTFGTNGWKSRVAGLRDTSVDMEGFWESAPDADTFTALGNSDRVFTLAPTSTVGSVAYLTQIGEYSYEHGGGVGDIDPFKVSGNGSNYVGAIRGQLAAAKGNVSATGAIGAGVNLGAVPSGQYLYAAFHVFTAATTLTVQLQSATSGAFSSPVTRATLGPITVASGVWATRVAGPITDTWYRFNVSAVTGTFNVAGAIGIG